MTVMVNDREFDRYLAESMRDPEFRSAYMDAGHRHELIDALVQTRHRQGLTQREVASRMGVKQPMVSEFENEGSDPQFSTIQRYARAVGARCVARIEVTLVEDDK
jgi:DNA-binding XRE family transcriptional regulator